MKGTILVNRELKPGYFMMTMEVPLGASAPGQFIMLRATTSNDPLLRRPMSIAGQEGKVFTVLYKVVGRGTELLAQMRSGGTIDADGPYGNSFSPARPENPPALLVGGGIGVAPLLFWARRNPGAAHVAFIGGAAEKDILCAGEFKKSLVATENGSAGEQGLVTAPLTAYAGFSAGACRVLACGPTGMLKAVDRLCAERGIAGELSLEERMGCGFGVCLGCMVDTGGGRKRMCVEGPVFKTGEVQWRT